VTGLYRYVRESDVPTGGERYCAIVGQALLFGNLGLLVYGGLVWLLCHVFVLVYEEPKLRASFGADYDLFCAGVPRWIPRLTAWDGGRDGPSPAAPQ
jgi:protein-S-isoprenylcysteine O-methyltransferase Ste14